MLTIEGLEKTIKGLTFDLTRWDSQLRKLGDELVALTDELSSLGPDILASPSEATKRSGLDKETSAKIARLISTREALTLLPACREKTVATINAAAKEVRTAVTKSVHGIRAAARERLTELENRYKELLSADCDSPDRTAAALEAVIKNCRWTRWLELSPGLVLMHGDREPLTALRTMAKVEKTFAAGGSISDGFTS
jgi:uncharacterized coiled-coil protein SlyX